MTTIPEEQPAADDPYRMFMRSFTRHEGALRCFVRTLLPTWDDVDEVMQDVSIAAWTKFDRFDPQTDFARWAATIARYEVLNYRRTKARDRLVFDEDLILLLADECQEEFAQSEQERRALDGCLDKNPPMIVESDPPTKNSVVDKPEPTAVVLTIAEQREQLLASAPDVLHLQLVSDNGGGVAGESGGDIVWSSGRQIGYLRLRGLTSNDPAQRQYQLWIVGSDVSGNEIINAGIFPVDRSTGELILAIQADQFVQQPKMFVVSVEPSGGGAALTAPLLAKADGVGP